MTSHKNLLDVAIKYHDALPKRIREYLNARSIPDSIINSHLLGWNGWRITIPIYNRAGLVTFFKLAKDPQDRGPAPKMLASAGATAELYGWERLLPSPPQIIICEGEFDRLVLEARGFAAVTSTAGVGCFRPEWAAELKAVENVYLCFDRDQAGRDGAAVASLMVPHAKFVELPEEVGQGGDVTDFFVTLAKSKDEFSKLLEAAVAKVPMSPARQLKSNLQPILSIGARIERIKREIPIERVVGEYVALRSGERGTFVGRCPFHNDRFSSFSIYPRSGMYYCFGCRAAGDVIAFIAAKDHISFGEAIDKLEQMHFSDGQTSEPTQQDQAA